MSAPMDPNNMDLNEPSEYSWGLGLFPPGVAGNEGQTKDQDNFGEKMHPPQAYPDSDDNYARAVADRRTDPTDAESTRDFEQLGNPDRYGGQPPLVRAEPQPNVSQREDRVGLPPLQRKW